MLLLSACGAVAPEPTPIPPTTVPPTTVSPTQTPRPTRIPTNTPQPTATPDIVATQQYEEFFTLLESFEQEGYISTTKGDTYSLSPFQEEWAQIGWFRWWTYDFFGSDLVFNAHFEWEIASKTPETSGCGVVFGLQENGEYYAVFLDKSRILFLRKRGSNLYEVGKTRGPGRVDFDNPAEADFALAVKDNSAFVSVDGEVTEYTLSQDQTKEGNFAVTLLSGTNSDYGTRCEMTDMMLWFPE